MKKQIKVTVKKQVMSNYRKNYLVFRFTSMNAACDFMAKYNMLDRVVAVEEV